MTIAPLKAEIDRDRFGRPLVVPPQGGSPVAYTRCTTYVGCLEDTYNLSRWQQRMVAIGLAESPDLMLQLASTDKEDKSALNTICEAAQERAKAHAAATIGTALHALTERLDRGQPVGVIPEAYQADLRAYETATHELTAVYIEQFSVNDELKIGGTPDRVVEYDGRLMIADLKTGSVSWGMGKIAMQLAVYAHSQMYDIESKTRSSFGPVDQSTAIVIHLPAGSGQAELIEVDIAAGWEAVQIATQVRAWRARKNLSRPLTPQMSLPSLPPQGGTVEFKQGDAERLVQKHVDERERLHDEIASAPSVERLTQLWESSQMFWDDNATALAKARRALLDNGVTK